MLQWKKPSSKDLQVSTSVFTNLLLFMNIYCICLVWSYTLPLCNCFTFITQTLCQSSLNFENNKLYSCRSWSQFLGLSEHILCVCFGVVNVDLRHTMFNDIVLFGKMPHALIFSCGLIGQILASHWKLGLILHYVIPCPSTPGELRSVAGKSKSLHSPP